MRASDRAYDVLFHEIVNGDLAPGAMLGEVEQAQRLGVSRTPLREALSRLTADGLVEPAPGRGVVVTEVSLEDITELYEVREALEEQVVRLAAQRRDPEQFIDLAVRFERAAELIESGEMGIRAYYELNERFDSAVDEAAGNSLLTTMLRTVRVHLSRVRRIAKDNPERLRQSAVETHLIVQAILDGDATLAVHAVHVHLNKSLNHIRASVHDPLAMAHVA